MKHRWKIPVLVLLLLSLATLAFAQEEGEKKEAKPDIDVAKVFKDFDPFVKEVMDEFHVAGLALAVVSGDKVIYAKGYGYADLENKREVTTETLFAIGSSTKAFTATCVAILVDKGKLSLDKPVRDYLPDFRMYDEYATQKMTPRDLLSHRSGLPRHDLLWYGSALDREGLYKKLQYLEPNKTFRDNFEYQNLMYMTAGYLAGTLNNTTWEQMVADEIWKPLDMNSSNFSVEDMQKVTDYSLPYKVNDEEAIELMDFRNIDAMGPAGSINSNVSDMAKWVMFNLNQGKVGEDQIVQAATLKELHTIVTPIRAYPQNDVRGVMGYGLGWFVEWYRGHYLLHHGGNIDGFSALVAFMPHQDYGLVILTNKNGAGRTTAVLSRNIYDRMLGLELHDWLGEFKEASAKAKAEAEKKEKEEADARVEGTKTSLPLESYAGVYENIAYGDIAIEVNGESLRGTYNGTTIELAHYHFDQFHVSEGDFKGFKVSFEVSERGTIDTMKVPLEPQLGPLTFTRKVAEKFKTVEYLTQFCGDYELQGQISTFALKGDILSLSVPGQPIWELEPIGEDEFRISNLPGSITITMQFKRDADKAITEVVFHQPNGVFTAKRKQD